MKIKLYRFFVILFSSGTFFAAQESQNSHAQFLSALEQHSDPGLFAAYVDTVHKNYDAEYTKLHEEHPGFSVKKIIRKQSKLATQQALEKWLKQDAEKPEEMLERIQSGIQNFKAFLKHAKPDLLLPGSYDNPYLNGAFNAINEVMQEYNMHNTIQVVLGNHDVHVNYMLPTPVCDSLHRHSILVPYNYDPVSFTGNFLRYAIIPHELAHIKKYHSYISACFNYKKGTSSAVLEFDLAAETEADNYAATHSLKNATALGWFTFGLLNLALREGQKSPQKNLIDLHKKIAPTPDRIGHAGALHRHTNALYIAKLMAAELQFNGSER